MPNITSISTLVFGASLKPERYSNIVIRALRKDLHETYGIGLRHGTIVDVELQVGYPDLKQIHTITMYMGEKRQKEHEAYLLSLKPKRIIFNPGAENPEFYIKAKSLGIEVINACTLVMLATGDYVLPNKSIAQSN